MRIVIKLGGALYAEGIDKLVNDIKNAAVENEIIIVHGGGPQITEIGEKMGRPAKYFNTPKGMKTRYTDRDQIENVKMAIGGLVNKGIVEHLQKVGVNAFGFTGLDGRTIVARRKDKIMIINEKGRRQILRGEFSGTPERVNTDIIEFIIQKNMVPVIGCMSISEEGDALNVDGDRAAIAIADALKADKYVSLTDVEGIYKNIESRQIIPKLTLPEAETLLNSGIVKGGMKKKLFAAIEAVKGNIKEFIIYSGRTEHPLMDILNGGNGTIITK